MTTPTDDQDIDADSLKAEIRWLKGQYETVLTRLRQQNEALRAGSAAPIAPEPPDDLDELATLKAEVERMRAGERRYLDRIEELKTALAALKHGVEGRF